MKITELSKIYLEHKVVSEATISHYRFVVRIFVRDIGVKDVADITTETLLRWRKVTLARKVSFATWNNYLRHMQALLGYAARNNLIAEQPDYRTLALRENDHRPKLIKRTELEAVMRHLSSGSSNSQPGWFWAVVFKTLYFTGMRRNQLVHLRWGDIDFEEDIILLRAESSKNRREWEVPMVAQLAPSIEELRRRTLALLDDTAELNERYVFDIALFSPSYRSCRNGRMSPCAISNFFSRLREETGVKVSAHKLRHTMATALARLGLYKELQCVLGHTDILITMRYVHPEIDSLRALVNNLEEIG